MQVGGRVRSAGHLLGGTEGHGGQSSERGRAARQRRETAEQTNGAISMAAGCGCRDHEAFGGARGWLPLWPLRAPGMAFLCKNIDPAAAGTLPVVSGRVASVVIILEAILLSIFCASLCREESLCAY